LFQNNVTAKNDSVSLPRKRKIKRPYSPEIHIRNERLFENRRGIRKQKRLHPAAEEGMTKQNNINIVVSFSVVTSVTSLPRTIYPEPQSEKKL
jgi:hypothetical protein